MDTVSKRRLIVIALFAWVVVLIIVVVVLLTNNIVATEKEKNRIGDKNGVISINGETNYGGGEKPGEGLNEFVEKLMYTTINYNTSTVLESGSLKDVNIRENSFSDNYDTKSGMHRVKYVVDIPSLQQSYIVKYSWSGKDENAASYVGDASVTCITPKLSIYPEFDCTDMYIEQENAGDVYPYANRFLYLIDGYKGVLSNGATFTVSRAKDSNNETYLRVTSGVCGPQSLAAEAKEILNNRMDYLDLRPEDYKINFEFYSCGDY